MKSCKTTIKIKVTERGGPHPLEATEQFFPMVLFFMHVV